MLTLDLSPYLDQLGQLLDLLRVNAKRRHVLGDALREKGSRPFGLIEEPADLLAGAGSLARDSVWVIDPSPRLTSLDAWPVPAESARLWVRLSTPLVHTPPRRDG